MHNAHTAQFTCTYLYTCTPAHPNTCTPKHLHTCKPAHLHADMGRYEDGSEVPFAEAHECHVLLPEDQFGTKKVKPPSLVLPS